MGKMAKSLKRAADEAERLVDALKNLPQGGAFSGSDGGGGGSVRGVTHVPSGDGGNITFVTNVQPAPPSSSSGGGGGGGGRISTNEKAIAKEVVRQFSSVFADALLSVRTMGGA